MQPFPFIVHWARVNTSILSVPVQRLGQPAQDLVAVEEPLQIRIGEQDIAITMRTPGHDRELAAGFLFSEGLIQGPEQIQSITCNELGTVTVVLRPGVTIDCGARNFYMTSSCGVCGKASIDSLTEVLKQRERAADDSTVSASILFSLPEKLRAAQAIFEHTGGLHAAGLFDLEGNLLAIREDVGRHNAVDKLIGGAFLEKRLPLRGDILLLSGRISFELVQKAVMAGIPIIAAVGAPSSLAIQTALRFGVTLAGFVRNGRGNIYAGAERIV